MERHSNITEHLEPNLHITKAGNQAVPNAVDTVITFDAVIGEGLAEFNLATNEFISRLERMYVMTVNVQIQQLAIGSWARVTLEDVAVSLGRGFVSGTNVRDSVCLAWTGYMAIGQTADIRVLHNDVGGISVRANETLWTISTMREDRWRN